MNGVRTTLRVNDREIDIAGLRRLLGSQAAFALGPSDYGDVEHRDKDGNLLALIICQFGDGRFSLCYDVSRRKDFSQGQMWVSVGDGDMNTFVELPLLEVLPEGSAVSAEIATAVLRDFLDNPHQLASSVEWIEEAKLNWPEELAP